MNLTGMRILLTGGAGFLGQHIKNKLMERGVSESSITVPRSREYDLRILEKCQEVTAGHDLVIHCAVHGFGIDYNYKHPAEIFDDNVSMGLNLMKIALQFGVKKFITIGSVCEYPDNAILPLTESCLWNGYPEESNAPYATAKRMMLVQGNAYRKQYGFNSIHLLLTNMYGPGNSFDPAKSHVIGALIVKIIQAIENNIPGIDVWGDGSSSREFLYVEDAAKAVIMAAENYNDTEPVNIGTGRETTIKELVKKICEITGYNGTVNWDISKPTGQSRQFLNVVKAANFGFKARTDLEAGLRKTIGHYHELCYRLKENK